MWFATFYELVYLQLQLWGPREVRKTRISSGVMSSCLWLNASR